MCILKRKRSKGFWDVRVPFLKSHSRMITSFLNSYEFSLTFPRELLPFYIPKDAEFPVFWFVTTSSAEVICDGVKEFVLRSKSLLFVSNGTNQSQSDSWNSKFTCPERLPKARIDGGLDRLEALSWYVTFELWAYHPTPCCCIFPCFSSKEGSIASVFRNLL